MAYLQMMLEFEGFQTCGAFELAKIRTVRVIRHMPLQLGQVGKLLGANSAWLQEIDSFIILPLVVCISCRNQSRSRISSSKAGNKSKFSVRFFLRACSPSWMTDVKNKRLRSTDHSRAAQLENWQLSELNEAKTFALDILRSYFFANE